jgi:hypothetical protein
VADLRVVEEEVPLGEEDSPIVIAVSAVKVTLPPPSVSSDVASPNANNKLSASPAMTTGGRNAKVAVYYKPVTTIAKNISTKKPKS